MAEASESSNTSPLPFQGAHWIPWNWAKNAQGKLTKVPAWSTKSQAVSYAKAQKQRADGVGFVFTHGVKVDGGYLVALDIDACRDPETGELTEWAEMVLGEFPDTYAAESPSGTGVHLWFITPRLLETQTVAKNPGPAAPNTKGKNPEIQLFGVTGSAQFITFDPALKLPDRPLHLRPYDIQKIRAMFGLKDRTPASDLPLPTGIGPEPSLTEIDDVVRSSDEGIALANGNWKLLNYPSASEAFFELERRALKAANGHGVAALNWLMNSSWGKGQIEDSRQPERYGDSGWVEEELKRTASKTAERDAAPFEPLPDDVKLNGAPKPQPKWTRTPATTDRSMGEMPPWLVRGWCRRGQCGVLGAAPTVGKSTLLANLCAAVAWGVDWLGEDTPVGGGNVVALVGEDEVGFRNMIEAAVQHRELPADCPNHIETVNFPDPLSTNAGRAQLSELCAEVIREHGKIDLVVIDTFSNHWAESEDKSEFVNPAIRYLGELARRLGAVVVLAHHLTKAAGMTVMPTLVDLRGSGTIGAGADFLWGACRTKNFGELLVEGLKLKQGRAPGRVSIRIVEAEIGFSKEDQEIVTAGTIDHETIEPVSALDSGGGVDADAETQKLALRVLRVLDDRSGTFPNKGSLLANVPKARNARKLEAFAYAHGQGWIEWTERKPVTLTDLGRTELAAQPFELDSGNVPGTFPERS